MENEVTAINELAGRLSRGDVDGGYGRKRPIRDLREKCNSLVSLCRAVVVANLERYPPEAFGICDEEEWVAIVKLRHNSTRPKEGQGGLDGTGRLVPAVGYKFLESVEEVNPHLSECVLVDETLWKDCVEYHFRRGGLTRPVGLLMPWPALVAEVKTMTELLSCSKTTGNGQSDQSNISRAMSTLSKIPMSVQLLQDSGAGKVLKKIAKNPHPGIEQGVLSQLNELLASWISLAATSGVIIKNHPSVASDHSSSKQDDTEDLKIAEDCLTWRQLFTALKKREDERRATQGKRMREIRKKLAASRPKLVKVRPSPKAPTRPGQFGLPTSNKPCTSTKLLQVKKEASIQSSRQQAPSQAKKPSFSNAVAFASGSVKKKVHGSTQKAHVVELPGDKRMRVPNELTKGTGPRHFLSKWKKGKSSIP